MGLIICHQYWGGKFTKQELADQHGISKSAIKKTLRAFGVPLDKKGKRTLRLLPSKPVVEENRILCKERANGLCQRCGQLGAHIHHKDFCPSNNYSSNLEFLCPTCHFKAHKKRQKKIKFFSNTVDIVSVSGMETRRVNG